MATITGYTVTKVQELFNNSVIDGDISAEGDLILERAGGSIINAGQVVPDPISAWPVGSIFMNVLPTNPSAMLGGGEWVRWAIGRVPIGVDPADTQFDGSEEIGGAKTHSLSPSELATHNHVTQAHGHSMPHTHTENLHSHTGPAHTHDAGSLQTAWAQGAPQQIAVGHYNNYTPSGDFVAVVGWTFPSHGINGSTAAAGSGSTGQASGGATGQPSNPNVTPQNAMDTSSTGSGAAHNNLQPYITCYIWKRVA